MKETLESLVIDTSRLKAGQSDLASLMSPDSFSPSFVLLMVTFCKQGRRQKGTKEIRPGPGEKGQMDRWVQDTRQEQQGRQGTHRAIGGSSVEGDCLLDIEALVQQVCAAEAGTRGPRRNGGGRGVQVSSVHASRWRTDGGAQQRSSNRAAHQPADPAPATVSCHHRPRAPRWRCVRAGAGGCGGYPTGAKATTRSFSLNPTLETSRGRRTQWDDQNAQPRDRTTVQ